MYTSGLLPRPLTRLGCICRYLTSVEGQKLPQISKSADGITPPLRIPRSPTDILEALAATVGPDPTAAHYKYHDDPFLIPLSNYRKRAYALSSEAGRKAAIWVRDNNPELFTTRVWDPPGKKKTPHFNADPHIDAFAPKPIYNDESKVTEDDLIYTINNALIDDSIKVFELLGGVKSISKELQTQLLELLCFYNEKEPESMEWMEERWFSTSQRDRQSTSWRLGGLADHLFTSMDPKTPEAYCAVIMGMAKYFQAERAHSLAKEAMDNGVQLSTDVFNSLIYCVGFLKEGSALRIEALKSTMQQMAEQGLTPNEDTLNACLKSVSSWGGGRILQQLSQQLMAEFRYLGIEPGLTAYYYLLCLYCKERGARVDILSSILKDLENRPTLEAKHPTDTKFFITAMGVCSDHLQDIKLADRVHALLMKGDNYKLVGDAYKESIYYRHYLTVACRYSPYEKTTELFDTLVPNVYVPEPSVLEEIIKTLELAGAGERLAQAWSQLVVFGHAKRTKLVEQLLAAMCNCYQLQEEDVKAKIRTAAADILKYGKLADEEAAGKDMRSPPPKMSATAICDIIELCSDVKDKSDPAWETVSEALQKLGREEATGVINKPTTLTKLAEQAAAVGKAGISAMALTYLAECGFDEAASGTIKTLATLLNRTEEEVVSLLSQPRSEIKTNLHPAAVALFDAYHLANSGSVAMKDKDDSSTSSAESSSSSDSESDDD